MQFGEPAGEMGGAIAGRVEDVLGARENERVEPRFVHARSNFADPAFELGEGKGKLHFRVFHRCGTDRPWPAIARFKRSGVTGSWVAIPNLPTASSIAPAIAAPTPLMPPSPAPLMPRGLNGLGASSVKRTSTCGTSCRLGSR